MAKPMRVMVEVEEVAHGKLFRVLDGMPGIVSITPIGDGPKSAGSGRTGVKQGGAASSECIVLGALIAAKGSVPRTELTKVLVSHGRSPSGVGTIMSVLSKKKEVKAVSGAGTKDVKYSVTSAGKKRFETACQIQQPEGA